MWVAAERQNNKEVVMPISNEVLGERIESLRKSIDTLATTYEKGKKRHQDEHQLLREVLFGNGGIGIVERTRTNAANIKGLEKTPNLGRWKQLSFNKKILSVIAITTFVLLHGALLYERLVDMFKAGLGV